MKNFQLELCEERCNSIETNRQDIINDINVSEEKFDLCLMMGNVSAVFSENQMERLFTNVYDILYDEGVFIFDFIGLENVPSGKNSDTIISNNIKVKRNVNYKRNGTSLKTVINYNLHINGDYHSFIENFDMRIHDSSNLENILGSKFDSAYSVKNEEYDHSIIVAEK